MNDAHLHLMANHFPIIGLVIGFLVLLFGLFFRDRKVRMTALGILIFSSLTALFANYTGELAEDVVENLSGVSEAHIETHEDVAELFLWTMTITGALALILIVMELKRIKRTKLVYIPLIIAIAVSGYFAKETGTTGGEIRHPEIRVDSQTTNPNSELNKVNK